jgi:hypothetical protein
MTFYPQKQLRRETESSGTIMKPEGLMKVKLYTEEHIIVVLIEGQASAIVSDLC